MAALSLTDARAADAAASDPTCPAKVLQTQLEKPPLPGKSYSVLVALPQEIDGRRQAARIRAAIEADSIGKKEGLDLRGTMEIRDERHEPLLRHRFTRVRLYSISSTTDFEILSTALQRCAHEVIVTIDNGCHLPTGGASAIVQFTYQGK
ncbi:hypothetical protein [Roseateles chitosanitabidus]|uniref:hypothetical protein n=1 Tax=Roseateles chitosanitabidus TaxID=65048 RepID=UPI0008323AB3|nr:hypothetical protein [Roseateles chitosanitabidus]